MEFTQYTDEQQFLLDLHDNIKISKMLTKIKDDCRIFLGSLRQIGIDKKNNTIINQSLSIL